MRNTRGELFHCSKSFSIYKVTTIHRVAGDTSGKKSELEHNTKDTGLYILHRGSYRLATHANEGQRMQRMTNNYKKLCFFCALWRLGVNEL